MLNFVGATIAIGLILAGALFLAKRNKNITYQCTSCYNVFYLTFWQAVLSPHKMGAKLAKCPKCGTTGWVNPVSK
jgi:ribosomal protein L33